MRTVLGKIMLGVAFLTCPCHLPIYLVLLGGTALGAAVSGSPGVTFALMGVVFLGALGAWNLLSRSPAPPSR
ncbi:MAG: mercury resistance protein [Candidatus Tectomicrobia bacterium]|uniref:Mercury resistance protein n=1 Tax=Tectimicrobiota bacterium TaxID=2528274 RepID=A0A932I076_UNCTE|nr:mercury resistance protein [Candidatus Tectomicrobia bacterium]